LLDTFFLDVDEYAPQHLFDTEDPFNIDEVELTKRASNILCELAKILCDFN